MNNPNLLIVGATGLIGGTFLNLIRNDSSFQRGIHVYEGKTIYE